MGIATVIFNYRAMADSGAIAADMVMAVSIRNKFSPGDGIEFSFIYGVVLDRAVGHSAVSQLSFIDGVVLDSPVGHSAVSQLRCYDCSILQVTSLDPATNSGGLICASVSKRNVATLHGSIS